MILEGRSLYEALGVERTATKAEIRKAYHKLALRLHPDKVQGTDEEKAEANARFQTLQRVMAVLGDDERRKVYDTTGSLEDSEELSGGDFDSLYEYYRDMYKKVTEDDIASFEQEYRGSDEEARDLKELFTQHSGDMDVVFQFLLCSRPELDSHRFMAVLRAAVAAGEVRETKRFASWCRRVERTPAPADPLRVRSGGVAKKKTKAPNRAGGGGEMDLAMMIRQNQAGRADSLFASLEAKYGGGGGKGGAKKKKAASSKGGGGEGGPSEEDFLAARKRVESKRKAKGN